MPTLGELLKRRMEARGIEGQQLAALLDRSPSFVSGLVNDRKKEAPEPAVLAALERVLGLGQREMLAALGYEVADHLAPFTANDARTDLIARIEREATETDAELMADLLSSLIRVRDARTVAEAERYANGIAGAVTPPGHPLLLAT